MPEHEREPTEQEEELLALQAIFPEELKLCPGTRYPIQIELRITTSVPVAIQLPQSSLMDDFSKVEQSNAKISHLPPLYMVFQLPVEYPLESPPDVKLSTQHDWLSEAHLKELEQEVIRLWEETGRTPILYSYIAYLMEASNDLFGLAASTLNLPGALATVLVDYDKSTACHIFQQSTFTCGICLEVLKGSACHQLQHCSHVFCVSCLEECYSSAIKEGNINNVKCVDPGCGQGSKMLSPKELSMIPVEKAVVKRYYDLRRKRLMGKDPETVWCPRPWCSGAAKSKNYPVIQLHELEKIQEIWERYDVLEEKKRSSGPVVKNVIWDGEYEPPPAKISEQVVCERCNFAFCRACLISWHGPYGNCDPPRDKYERSRQELRSKLVVQKCSVCPGCKAPYEKISGCLHMKCTNCGVLFNDPS
jgi:E3 ubiquitin-protein ligase RNF14